MAAANVITWGCPVPSFGDLLSSTVATLGLNPSNREFVDRAGDELCGNSRRLHTLHSLGLRKWSDATKDHVKLILDSCRGYFKRNPYDGWFRSLDALISGTNTSYYSDTMRACHLDLIPYATLCKWTELTRQQRAKLIDFSGDALGMLLQGSPVRCLILNGVTVIQNLERLTGITLKREVMSEWTLPRRSTGGVRGYSYQGVIQEIGGALLPHPVHVLGFNHNIQSSFGVTSKVKLAIQDWIAISVKEAVS